jgi:hypothetical protein
VPRTRSLSTNRRRLEETLRDALKTVFGSTGTGVNPRADFYNKFQREMEEHDRDFERKYDEDLNTTLIFVSVHSCVVDGASSFKLQVPGII